MTTIPGPAEFAGHTQVGGVLGGRRTPSPIDVLDAIDLQLVADSDEVVLSRDHAEVLAALLNDICGAPTERR